jgi:hypothetical protein
MSTIEQQIQKLVADFVADITALARADALKAVGDALGGLGSAKAVKPAKAPRGRRGGKPTKAAAPAAESGKKRSAAQLQNQAKKIVDAVKQQPGIRADQLSAALGVPTRNLALPIKKLLAEKALSKKGQKRATAYYPGRG